MRGYVNFTEEINYIFLVNFLPIFISFLGVTAVEFVDTFATKNDYTLNACCIGKQTNGALPLTVELVQYFHDFFQMTVFLIMFFVKPEKCRVNFVLE